MSQSIYIVKSAYGPIKVGISKKIHTRVSELQVNSPVDITVEYAATSDGNMRAVEKLAHKILAAKRMRGEWFKADASEAIAAITQAAQELGYDLTLTPIELRNRGRPPTGQELAQVRLDRDTAQAVRAYIERTGLTRSAALRTLIRAGLASRQADANRRCTAS